MNHYEILKVSKNASQQEIRDSYINLIKQYHPDIYKGSKEYGEKITKQLNDAYDILSVPEKRSEYDLTLEPPKQEYTPPDYNYTIYTNHSNRNKYYNERVQEEPPKESFEEKMKKNIHRVVEEQSSKMSKKAKTDMIILIILIALFFMILAIGDYINLIKVIEARKAKEQDLKRQRIEMQIQNQIKEKNEVSTI